MAWEDIDERCPYCGQVTKVARGVNKQNLKRLFLSKPSMQDMIVLFTIIMVLLVAWRYQAETEQCRLFIDNHEEICLEWNEALISMDASQNYPDFNLTEKLQDLVSRNDK